MGDLQHTIYFVLSCFSKLVFISSVEEEGKHLVNCLQASIRVVSTFVELDQTVKQVVSAVQQSIVISVHSHSEQFLELDLNLLLSFFADKNSRMPCNRFLLQSFSYRSY